MGRDSLLKNWLSLKSVNSWVIILATTGALATTGVGIYQFYQLKEAKQKEPPPVVTEPVKTLVTALGRLEPQGEVIKLSAPSSMEGTLLSKLLVKQGDRVEFGQIIAILDNYNQRLASLEQAKKQVEVAQANLAKVKVGAKTGEIEAQKAEIARLEAQLNGEFNTQKAILARLEAQLLGERKTQQATIARLQAQLGGEQKTQQATIARLQAQLSGEKKTQQATIARLQAQLSGEKKTQQATIARIEAQVRNAYREFQRYEMLYKQGAIEASKYDSKRLEWETATELLNEAKSNLTKSDETILQQINEAKAILKQSEETLQKQIEETQANRTQTEDTLQQQINEAKSSGKQTIDTLQEQIRQAKARLNEIAEVRPTDVKVSQAEVESAMATVRKAQTDLDLSYVRSPITGQVLKINSRPGERISDQGILELGQTDQMYVVAEVYQTEIDQVRIGQSASIKSTTFSDELQGTVAQIGLQIGKKNILNDDPAAAQDARVVEVKIRLTPEDSKRVSGLTNLQVEVIIDVSPTSEKSPENSIETTPQPQVSP